MDDSVTKPPPKHAAARPNFNQLLVAGSPKSFEAVFQKIETAAAPVFAKILNSRSLENINENDRLTISRFVAAQSFRTEAYRKGLSASSAKYDVGQVIDLLLSDLQTIAEFVAARRWALLVTTDYNPFYLGDNPVVLQSTEHPGSAGQLGLDMAGVEAFMPISPMCALYMPCPATGREIVEGYWNALRVVTAKLGGIELSDFDITSTIPISRRVLESAGPMYVSLVRGQALPADPENVENLNYLQCAWASSAVYSNMSDFSFALRVFKENPEYRKSLPVSLTKRW